MGMITIHKNKGVSQGAFTKQNKTNWERVREKEDTSRIYVF